MATPEPLVLSWLSLEQCEQAVGGLTAIKRWNGEYTTMTKTSTFVVQKAADFHSTVSLADG